MVALRMAQSAAAPARFARLARQHTASAAANAVACGAGHPPLTPPCGLLQSARCFALPSLSARLYAVQVPTAVPLLCDFEAIPQAKILQFLPYQLNLLRTPKVHKTHEICSKKRLQGSHEEQTISIRLYASCTLLSVQSRWKITSMFKHLKLCNRQELHFRVILRKKTNTPVIQPYLAFTKSIF